MEAGQPPFVLYLLIPAYVVVRKAIKEEANIKAVVSCRLASSILVTCESLGHMIRQSFIILRQQDYSKCCGRIWKQVFVCRYRHMV